MQASEEIVLYGFGLADRGGFLAAGYLTQSGILPFLPAVQIGGRASQVVFAGLISPGLSQFNVVVPPTAADGDNAVTAVYDGSRSAPLASSQSRPRTSKLASARGKRYHISSTL